MKPLASLGNYLIVGADELAPNVADELVMDPVPYLVIRRETPKQILWDVRAVDDDLFSSLSGVGSIESCLNLQTSMGKHSIKLVDVFKKKRLPALSTVKPNRVVLDPSGLAVSLVGALPLAELDAALYPKLVPSVRAIDRDQVIEIKLELLSKTSEELAALLDIHFGADEEFVALHASVSSEAFTMPAGTTWSKEFKVNRDLTTDPGVWNFKVQAAGDRERYSLRVTFMARGKVLGNVVLTLPSTARRALAASVSTSGPLTIPAADAQDGLALIISEDGPTYRRIMATSGGTVLGDGRFEIAADSPYFSELQKARTLEAVQAIGLGLWTDLPESIRDVLADESLDNGSALTIVASAPYAPFEIVSDGGEFLGVRRPVLRWVHEVPHRAQTVVPKGEMLCIRPTYGGPDHLPSAVEEETFLAGCVPGLERATTEDALKVLLDRPSIHAIHFAGHAQTSPPLLKLENGGVIRPTFFTPKSQLMKQGKPFLFLNGCHAGTGRIATPSAQGNMVKMLLMFGATSVVAPAIEVQSAAARDVAKAFYGQLAAGASIPEAIHHVRQIASKADPTHIGSYFSYLAFASPLLRLTWPA